MERDAGLVSAVDFTVYGQSAATIDQMIAGAPALAASGVGLGMIGFDISAAAAEVRNAFVAAGMAWGGYRLPVAGSAVAGVQSTIGAMLQSPTPARYFCVDVEPTNGVVVPIGELEAALSAADAMLAGTGIVKLIYSGLWVFEDYYPGYVALSQRGDWLAWLAVWDGFANLDASAGLCFGFEESQVAGKQYGSGPSPIGNVDLSEFAAPVAPPSPIDPASALARIITSRGLYAQAAALQAQAAALMQQGDANAEAAEEDLTP